MKRCVRGTKSVERRCIGFCSLCYELVSDRISLGLLERTVLQLELFDLSLTVALAVNVATDSDSEIAGIDVDLA
jgi:hypothetical protein